MNIYRLIRVSFPAALAACGGTAPVPSRDATPWAAPDADTISPEADTPDTIPAFDALSQIPFDSGIQACPVGSCVPGSQQVFCVNDGALLTCSAAGRWMLTPCDPNYPGTECYLVCHNYPYSWCAL